MKGKMECIYKKLKTGEESIRGFVRVLCTFFFQQYPSIGVVLILAIMMLIFKEEVTVCMFMFWEKWGSGT